MPKKRRSQSASNSNRTILGWLVRSFGVFVVALLAVLVTYGMVGYLQRSWSGDDPYRLLFTDSRTQFRIVEIIPKPVRVGIVAIPQDVMFDVLPVRYGEYRLGALLELADIEGYGDEMILRTVSYGTGLLLDDVVRTTTGTMENLEEHLDSEVLSSGFFGSINIADSVRLWMLLREVDASQIVKLNLNLAEVYAESIMGNAFMDQRRFNDLLLEEALNQWQQVYIYEKDTTQVKIVNGTNYPGLATSFGRLLSREGFQVISLDDQEIAGESLMLVRPRVGEAQFNHMSAIARSWDIKIDIGTQYEDSQLDQRVDALVVLKEDLLQ